MLRDRKEPLPVGEELSKYQKVVATAILVFAVAMVIVFQWVLKALEFLIDDMDTTLHSLHVFPSQLAQNQHQGMEIKQPGFSQFCKDFPRILLLLQDSEWCLQKSPHAQRAMTYGFVSLLFATYCLPWSSGILIHE